MAKQIGDDSMRCSFCHKSKGVVGKLISSPNDYPRVYICDECVSVCYSVIEDDKAAPEQMQEDPAGDHDHPLLRHPLASSLMQAIENWIRDESLGKNWVIAFGEVRRLAMQMMNEPWKRHHT